MKLSPQALAAERSNIKQALRLTGGNVAKAARVLAMPKRTMWRRLKKLQIRIVDLHIPEIKAKHPYGISRYKGADGNGNRWVMKKPPMP